MEYRDRTGDPIYSKIVYKYLNTSKETRLLVNCHLIVLFLSL